MNLHLVKSDTHSDKKVAGAIEDARVMLFKGYNKSLAWGASVFSTASTILGCEVEDLLDPNLYFNQELCLREAVKKELCLPWSDWVARVEAHIIVTEFNCFHPEQPETVLNAYSELTRDADSDLSPGNLRKLLSELESEKSSSLEEIEEAPSQNNTIESAIAKSESVTIEEPPSVEATNPECRDIVLWTPTEAISEPEQDHELVSIDKEYLENVEEKARLYKSAFKALDSRAKKKISSKSKLLISALKCLRTVTNSRNELELSLQNLVYLSIAGVTVLFGLTLVVIDLLV